MPSFFAWLLHRRYLLTFLFLQLLGWGLLATFKAPFHQQIAAWALSLKETVARPLWWWRRMENLSEENATLRRLLAQPKTLPRPEGMVAMSVVEMQWTPRHVVMIVGPTPPRVGITKGMPVLGPRGGVIGVVMAGSAHYLMVETILSQRLPWVVSIKGISTVLEWTGSSNRWPAVTLPASAPVVPGDTVFVHPSFASFFPGMPLGVVGDRRLQAREGVVRVTIKPIEDLSALSVVLVPLSPHLQAVDSLTTEDE